MAADHLLTVDSADMSAVSLAVRSRFPKVSEFVSIDLAKTSIKQLILQLRTRDLIPCVRAFVIHSGARKGKDNDIRLDRNPCAALAFLQKNLNQDAAVFLAQDFSLMDRAAYRSLGLEAIAPFSQRLRLRELLDYDCQDQGLSLVDVVKHASSRNILVFVAAGAKRQNKEMQQILRQAVHLQLTSAQRFGRPPDMPRDIAEDIRAMVKQAGRTITQGALNMLYDYAAGNINTLTSELNRLLHLVREATISATTIERHMQAEPTMTWFWYVQELLTTSFSRASALLKKGLSGDLKLNQPLVAVSGFPLVLVSRLAVFMHQALYVRYFLDTDRINIQRVAYQNFKTRLLPAWQERVRTASASVNNKRLDPLSLNPFRLYQLCQWVDKHSAGCLEQACQLLFALDRDLKSRRIHLQERLAAFLRHLYCREAMAAADL